MSEQEIIEGNKLIAEFIGMVESAIHEGWYDDDEILPEYLYDNRSSREVANLYTELHFHESWDWLMPTCHKIAKINALEIEKNDILSMPKWEFGSLGLESDIKLVWVAVVEFIKWYNSCQKEK